MGDVFGQHWCPWQVHGAGELDSGVLCTGYPIPSSFRQPLTCGSETYRVPFLWLWVFKCPGSSGIGGQNAGKAALKVIENPGLKYYSWLFLSVLNHYGLTPYKMETVSSSLGSVRKRDMIFSMNLRDTYFKIPIYPEFSTLSLKCLIGQSVSALPQPLRSLLVCFFLVSEWTLLGRRYTCFGIWLTCSSFFHSDKLKGRTGVLQHHSTLD